MYKDGFSVGDDGDFRPISDPKNKKLLDALHQVSKRSVRLAGKTSVYV